MLSKALRRGAVVTTTATPTATATTIGGKIPPIYKGNARANTLLKLTTSKFLKFLAIILLAVVTNLPTFAAPTSELSAFDAQIYQNFEQNDAARAFDSSVAERFSEEIELAPSISWDKERYYVGELITADIEITTSSNKEFKLELSFEANDEMKIWRIEKPVFHSGRYRARAFLQPLSANARLYGLTAVLLRSSEAVGAALLEFEQPRLAQPPHDKFFSHIVAANLDVPEFSCNQYDEEHIICSAALVAEHAAFSEVAVRGALQLGLNARNSDFERNEAFISAILGSNVKKIIFSYFNPLSARFVHIERGVELSSDTLSTQSDLAPVSRELGLSTQIICLALAIICTLLVLYFRRFYGLLAAAVIFASLGLISQGAAKDARLEGGSAVQILPMERSSVFARPRYAAQVLILGEYADFAKIQLPDGRIGWVKKSALR